ncbi:MAG: hypothetical protein AWU57_3818, partial [Marinobacter sp. T13-3]
KDFSVYSWLFVTPGFYPVSTDDLLEANVRFCLAEFRGCLGRKANIQTHLIATTFLASHGARYKLGS